MQLGNMAVFNDNGNLNFDLNWISWGNMDWNSVLNSGIIGAAQGIVTSYVQQRQNGHLPPPDDTPDKLLLTEPEDVAGGITERGKVAPQDQPDAVEGNGQQRVSSGIQDSDDDIPKLNASAGNNESIRIVNGKKEYNVNGKWLTESQFSALRQKAVRDAWSNEIEIVKKTGYGSRDWTSSELEELLTTNKVSGYEGQHMKSATRYPDYAGDPENIQFLKGRNMDINEHLAAHNGNYSNPTNWYYNPTDGTIHEFGNGSPIKPYSGKP
jgi:hypothetical protein